MEQHEQTEEGPKQYTRDEIAYNKPENQTLIIIDNIVYDVHKFLDEHPGGHEVLLNVAGKDASEQFEDVGHSIDAQNLMQRYAVGELADYDKVPVTRRRYTWEDATKSPEPEPSFVNSWKFPVLLGLLLTVIYSYIIG